jgi:hypothetical protein
MPYEQSAVTMAQNLETLVLKPFAMTWVLNTSFRVRIRLPQNGVVERKNMTLCEMARTMLDEHRTSRRFWAKAVNTACYVSNRIYLSVHMKKTCYELMHDRTLKVSHLHVFGCKCFILKKGKKLDKFEARSVDGIFLVMYLTLEHIVCSILKLTKSWRLAG